MSFPLPADHALDRYGRVLRRRVLVLAALTVAVFASFCFDLVVGPSDLGVVDVLAGLVRPESLSRGASVILWDVRLPYSLMALIVGAALSLAGAEMQTILNNPLASPFTLGVSSAASFGAALAIVVGVGIPGLPQSWIAPANAFLFAFLSVLLLQALARLRGAGVETLVLFGIALAFAFNALVALMQFLASQEALQQLVFWSMGSLSRGTWENLPVLAVIVACTVPFSLNASWKMTVLRFGEDRARSFGINVPRLRFASLLRVSLLAATAVAFVGTIGFVGLVGPHITRLLLGEDHRFFLPGAMLTGALVMSLASIASRSLVPGVIVPVGIVTALVGVPFFLALILGRRERS